MSWNDKVVSTRWDSRRHVLRWGILAITLPMLACAAPAAQQGAASSTASNKILTVSAFCLGQAMLRTPKMTSLLKSKNEIQGISAVYVGQKGLFLADEMTAMYDLLKEMPDGNTALLKHFSKIGKESGAKVAAIEERCIMQCRGAQDVRSLGSCVDACGDSENSQDWRDAKECDALYLKSRNEALAKRQEVIPSIAAH